MPHNCQTSHHLTISQKWKHQLCTSLFLYPILATIHRYQNYSLPVEVGECVNFTARSYYSVIHRPTATVRITWKKNTHPISNKKPWYANNENIAFKTWLSFFKRYIHHNYSSQKIKKFSCGVKDNKPFNTMSIKYKD